MVSMLKVENWDGSLECTNARDLRGNWTRCNELYEDHAIGIYAHCDTNYKYWEHIRNHTITTAHLWCDDHSICINAYGVWKEKEPGFKYP